MQMIWTLYSIIAGLAILSQLIYLLQAYNNYRYALQEAAKERGSYMPRTLLTIPCKGLDREFEKNIGSFYQQDYDYFDLHFVVESEEDEAYGELCRLKEQYSRQSRARKIRILVAGHSESCSQKIHNLLHSIQEAADDIEIFAFADSDAYVRDYWLAHLVHPLRKEKTGATTGYRWFIPQRHNAATLALTSINAKVAQLLGNTHFNQAWGGSMAIRRDIYDAVDLGQIWRGAISDDLCLSWAVKKAGKKVVFVPACLVASFESVRWKELFEFAIRQFVITRVTTPGTWLFGLLSSIFTLSGLWVGAAFAAVSIVTEQPLRLLHLMVPLVFLAGQIIRGLLRQRMIFRLLGEHRKSLEKAAAGDILGNFLWSWITLGCIAVSGFRRTITWRNITYKLISPTKTVVIRHS